MLMPLLLLQTYHCTAIAYLLKCAQSSALVSTLAPAGTKRLKGTHIAIGNKPFSEHRAEELQVLVCCLLLSTPLLPALFPVPHASHSKP